MTAVTRYDMTPKQIALVKATVAKDCNDEEFNLFCEVARAKGLDPFLGQIIPMVFSKGDAEKRKMTIIITRDGQRVIAQRCGDYRPASKLTQFETDKALMSRTNPLGIVSATVYLWKRDPKSGEWFEVVGQAYWDEFAPIKRKAVGGYQWEDTGEIWPDSGKPKKKKVAVGEEVEVLDDSGNWSRMPRLMIEKCAQMQALRAGWPEQYSGTYDEAEIDRAKVLDLTASEVVEKEREDHRMRIIGADNSITVTWGDNWALDNVPVGKFADEAMRFIKESPPETVAKWRDANREPLKRFWALQPGDALALKKEIEAAIARKPSRPAKGPSDADLMKHSMAAG
ncbi:phage recombination protein Bet [Sinorhizobium medicae]|uniref:phage recombination protein Bet n=1 Tax=Sinorhizobium medicae TaxID=110321 RepID=UPI002AF6A379|nr:phage recombination protein Bet [Sinorhizobium medicae]WQO87578.1 phage recombination protein Bet [Sinorhizobium medicae]